MQQKLKNGKKWHHLAVIKTIRRNYVKKNNGIFRTERKLKLNECV